MNAAIMHEIKGGRIVKRGGGYTFRPVNGHGAVQLIAKDGAACGLFVNEELARNTVEFLTGGGVEPLRQAQGRPRMDTNGRELGTVKPKTTGNR